MIFAEQIKTNTRAILNSGLKFYSSLSVSFVLLILTLIKLFRPDYGERNLFVPLFFIILAAAGVFILISRNEFSPDKFYILLPALILSLWLRAVFMDYVSHDYSTFLSKWMEFFYDGGGFLALKDSIGDYNVPYLYYLAFLSYLKLPALYGIKLLSIVFDFMLAYFGMKITGLVISKPGADMPVFVLILLIPTVFLNSACWAQCDSIFTAFIFISLYFAFTDKPVKSMAGLALAFAFKLQTVFIMPLFLILLFARKIKIRHIFVFPCVFFITLIPALLLGKPLDDALSIYLHQTGTYKLYLTLNAPSVFVFFTEWPLSFVDILSALGIIVTAIFTLTLCLCMIIRRDSLTNKLYLHISLIFTAGIPFLLPHMHDRYFFIADVLSLLYAFMRPDRIAIPVLTIFASFGAYYAYLRLEYLYPMKLGAFMICIAVLVLIYDLALSLREPETLAAV